MSNQQRRRGDVAATGVAALAKGNVAVGAGGECDLGCSKEGSVSMNPAKKGFSRLKTEGDKKRKSSSTQKREKRNTCQERHRL